MKHFKFLALMLAMIAGISIITSCGDNDDEDEVVIEPNVQSIPKELCGTWYEVNIGDNYYQYLTINEDGSVEASYYSLGNITEERGTCYYNKGEIIFTYNSGGKWMQLFGAERTIVEWTSSNLILGYFNASFFARSREANFSCNERNPELIGTWKYYQTATATSTLNLTARGGGYSEFESQLEHTKDNIVDWFTRNGWIYIKYSGKTAYTLYRYNKSGDTMYLYYADVIKLNSSYDYHKQ